MNAIAVGIDLVEIARVRRMMDRFGDKMLGRVLTDAEAAYCRGRPRPEQHVAARLAAKEAAYKALQLAGGARAVGWRDLEVIAAPDGRPRLAMWGRAAEAAGRLNASDALISLTHAEGVAGAVVILLG